MPIQDAIDGAGEGDMICVHVGTNARECGCGQATYADRRWRGCVRLLKRRRRRRRGIGWLRGQQAFGFVGGAGLGPGRGGGEGDCRGGCLIACEFAGTAAE